jgi:hypothetical protein
MASTSGQLWRAAPLFAAVSLGAAALSRWARAPAILPLSIIALGITGLAAYWWTNRRDDVMSDAIAAGVDADAGLGGELRSASWFAACETRDPWAAYHVDRAAERLRGIDWSELYPVVHAPRAKLATSILVLGALALTITLPGRVSVSPGASATAALAAPARSNFTLVDLALPELRKELEALLASAETGTALPGTPATAAELRRLLAKLGALRDAGKLKDLARAMTSPGAVGRSDEPARDMKALADRAQKAAERPAVAPEVRDTLKHVSEDMTEAAKEQSPKELAREATGSKDAQKGDPKQGKNGGDADQISIQSVSEADAGGGAGIIMMDKDQPGGKASPGLGFGGGSDPGTNGGRMADLKAALRRETIEANADNPGENVLTEAHRKTEHSHATVTYAHSATGTFDRSRAVPPPVVPEGRRAAVQTYFLRKQ